MRGRSRRTIMMIGRASFIGLIPRHWMTIAAIQWQFLATAEHGILCPVHSAADFNLAD